MTISKLILVAAAVFPTTASAQAQELTVQRNLRGPEGPLYIAGNLYYVGWMSDTLSKWDGKKTTILNHTPGCGHNGLALTKHKTFLLACTDDPGAILELDMNGKQLARWDVDSKGGKFVGGINDIVVTANDGAYATIFGPFVGQPSAVIGRVLFKASGSNAWVEVAGDLDYANGVGLSPDQKTLYVSQTVTNTILKFTIERDGTLSHRSNFAFLNLLTPNKVASAWLGPDSMKIDSKGNIYVAQWCGGKVLKISPEGKLLHLWEIAAGNGTTNIAFADGGKSLYVTVVKDPDDPQAIGSIVKIPNVE